MAERQIFENGVDKLDVAEELFALTKKLDDAGYTSYGDMTWYAAGYIKELEEKLSGAGKRMYS